MGATLPAMFEIAVEAEFSAAHALTSAGGTESVHGHNWLVRAVVAGERLDEFGLLCDFQTVREVLEEIVGPWRNRNLNEAVEFAGQSPTAERMAVVVAEALASRLDEAIRPQARVASVRVREAPGCEATYVRP